MERKPKHFAEDLIPRDLFTTFSAAFFTGEVYVLMMRPLGAILRAFCCNICRRWVGFLRLGILGDKLGPGDGMSPLGKIRRYGDLWGEPRDLPEGGVEAGLQRDGDLVGVIILAN